MISHYLLRLFFPPCQVKVSRLHRFDQKHSKTPSAPHQQTQPQTPDRSGHRPTSTTSQLSLGTAGLQDLNRKPQMDLSGHCRTLNRNLQSSVHCRTSDARQNARKNNFRTNARKNYTMECHSICQPGVLLEGMSETIPEQCFRLEITLRKYFSAVFGFEYTRTIIKSMAPGNEQATAPGMYARKAAG